MSWWPIAFLLFAASLLPVQAAMNAAINRVLHQPPVVVMTSLAGSLVSVLAMVALGRRMVMPTAGQLVQVPLWAWPAGVCGAVFLLSQPVVLPRIGAAAFTGIAVTAQIVCAVALDHFGLLGVPRHDASPLRLAGAALMIAGIVLVARN